jgi:hypothetical protein
MNVRIRLKRGKLALYEGTYEVSDAKSFGAACEDIWMQVREQRLAQATSIGALMESQEDSVLGDLVGAEIAISADCQSIKRARPNYGIGEPKLLRARRPL